MKKIMSIIIIISILMLSCIMSFACSGGINYASIIFMVYNMVMVIILAIYILFCFCKKKKINKKLISISIILPIFLIIPDIQPSINEGISFTLEKVDDFIFNNKQEITRTGLIIKITDKTDNWYDSCYPFYKKITILTDDELMYEYNVTDRLKEKDTYKLGDIVKITSKNMNDEDKATSIKIVESNENITINRMKIIEDELNKLDKIEVKIKEKEYPLFIILREKSEFLSGTVEETVGLTTNENKTIEISIMKDISPIIDYEIIDKQNETSIKYVKYKGKNILMEFNNSSKIENSIK